MRRQLNRFIRCVVCVSMVYAGIYLAIIHVLNMGYSRPSDVEGYILTPAWGTALDVSPIIALAVAAVLYFYLGDRENG